MSVLDGFRHEAAFPFYRYFSDADEYAGAKRYWVAVVNAVPSFSDPDWTVIPETMPLQDDMRSGRMLWLEATDGGKQIMLFVSNVEGAAREMMHDNCGIDPEEEGELRALFGEDFPITDAMRLPLSYAEALKTAEEQHSGSPVRTWVELLAPWSEGDEPVERLYLTAEISDEAELLALRALDLFMQPGAGLARVNAVFSPEA
ncbi:hypothetical protein JJJ17_11775 [Paracoccus caeni]|uniref:Uncharacterized protein n=1 Tax=Paracoccus caeni TaxID=657651 RepID=A0A934SJT1_9RHOB|nr:hypothetical protein [Paracoccus caeni]MBK4216607.1 hypothetical protein [Paracoccus caeni]